MHPDDPQHVEIPSVWERQRLEHDRQSQRCPKCGMARWSAHTAEICDTIVFRREQLELLSAIHDKLDTLVKYGGEQ